MQLLDLKNQSSRTTSIEGGTEVKRQAAVDVLVRRARIEACETGVLAHSNSEGIDLLPQGSLRTHIVDHLAHAPAAARNPAPACSRRCRIDPPFGQRGEDERHEPASAPEPARRWRRSLRSRAAHQRGARPQVCGADGGEHSRGSGPITRTSVMPRITRPRRWLWTPPRTLARAPPPPIESTSDPARRWKTIPAPAAA